MKISVATLPEGVLGIQRELEMLKTSLLYGDEVNLYSPMVAILMNATEIASKFTTEERLDLAIRLAALIEPDLQENYQYQLDSYREFSNLEENLKSIHKKVKQNRNKMPGKLRDVRLNIGDAKKAKKFIENKGKASWAKLDEHLNDLRNTLQIDKLDRAIKSKRLKVHDMNSNKGDGFELLFRLGQGNHNIDHLLVKPAQTIATEVMNLMLNPNEMYPLIDDKFSEVFRTSKTNNHLNKMQISKAKNVSLVSKLFDSLPNFENLPFDEVLDIHEELKKPLANFRRAIRDYTMQIESPSWEVEFENEVQNLIEIEIKPAIENIIESIEENTALRHIVKEARAASFLTIIGFALSFNATTLSESQIQLLVALGLVDIVAGVRNRLEESKKIQHEKLFFYYKIQKKLSR